MLVGRVGDHHPHLDAAASEGHRTFDGGYCIILIQRCDGDAGNQRCDHRRTIDLDGEPTGFQRDASDELSDELAARFDWIGFELGHQHAASIKRIREIRSGRKLLNPISELCAVVKGLSQLDAQRLNQLRLPTIASRQHPSCDPRRASSIHSSDSGRPSCWHGRL